MRRHILAGLAAILAGAVLAGLAGALETGADQDKHTAALTDRMTNYCVGRILIDMPEAAQVELGQARFHGFIIPAFPETQKRLADREAQIKAKPDRHGGNDKPEPKTEVKSDSGLAGKSSFIAEQSLKALQQTEWSWNAIAMKVRRLKRLSMVRVLASIWLRMIIALPGLLT